MNSVTVRRPARRGALLFLLPLGDLVETGG
jgi:hypothetical protein